MAASFKGNLIVLFHAMFLIASAGKHCGDEGDKLFKNINDYRTLFLGTPALTRNKKAGCLANKIVDKLEKNCTGTIHLEMVKPNDYPAQLTTCIGTNQTTDGAVLPVCMSNYDQEAAIPLLHNYTRTRYAMYLKDSNFTGIGVGSNDHWMVVVLNKNTTTWTSSAGPNSLVTKVGFGHCLVSLLLGMFFSLLL